MRAARQRRKKRPRPEEKLARAVEYMADRVARGTIEAPVAALALRVLAGYIRAAFMPFLPRQNPRLSPDARRALDDLLASDEFHGVGTLEAVDEHGVGVLTLGRSAA